MNVLITGGAGFIGRTLAPILATRGHSVLALVRRGEDRSRVLAPAQAKAVGDLGAQANLASLFEGIDAVVHLAARVHHDNDSPSDEEAHRVINAQLTRTLAEQAAKSGVKRFVYISSVKAVGERTEHGLRWTETSPCAPQTGYGRAKLAAEIAVADISRKSRMEQVTLRFPLVYGPGVRANMSRLMGLVNKGFPLPLGSIENSRSLLCVENACDAIAVTLEHSEAKGNTFFVSDGEDLSTPDLIRALAAALGRTPRLLPCPPLLLKAAAAATGYRGELERLMSSLAVDITKIKRTLSWTPPYTVKTGLARAAAWWKAQ